VATCNEQTDGQAVAIYPPPDSVEQVNQSISLFQTTRIHIIDGGEWNKTKNQTEDRQNRTLANLNSDVQVYITQ